MTDVAGAASQSRSSRQSRTRRLIGPAAVGVGAVAAAAALGAASPGDSGFIACPFRALTGLDCPFCGATRATAALMNGDLLAALDHNLAFVVAVVPLALLDWVLWVRSAWRDEEFPSISTRTLQVALLLTLAWWALRLVVPWLGSSLSG